MSKIIVTDKSILAARPGTSRKEIPVEGAPGLYLIVQPSGARSWAIRYRFNNKTYKTTIGAYPLITLKVARDEARRVKDAVAKGVDPTDMTEATDYTFGGVFAEYMTRHHEARNVGTTIKTIRSMANTSILPYWKDRDVRNISRRDVVQLLDRLIDRGTPVQANRVLTSLKKFFKWCIERGVIEGVPPTLGMSKPAPEKERERVLTEDQLNLIWRAAGRIGFPYGTVTKALMLTGQRKMEVGGVSYAEFGTRDNAPVWLIPKERCKNKREQLLPVMPLLADVFATPVKVKGKSDFIFTNDGETVVNAYDDAKKLIDATTLAILQEEAGEGVEVENIPHWTFHDLRRTCATGMAEMGVEPHVVEAVLNHKSGVISGTSARYNRYSYFAEKKAALSLWETYIRRVCLGETNVVPLFQPTAG